MGIVDRVNGYYGLIGILYKEAVLVSTHKLDCAGSLISPSPSLSLSLVS